MVFSVQVLGASAALPAFDRHPTAQIVNHNEKLYLIDCGEGTQMRLNDFKVKKSKINSIFISHMHGDHYFGLVGLISSYCLLGREAPLSIYGPAKLKPILEIQLACFSIDLPFKLDFIEVPTNVETILFEDDLLVIKSFPVNHGIPCTGFLFTEKLRERNMIKSKIQEYSIHFTEIIEIKKGKDFTTDKGERIKNQDLTIDPPKPRTYAFCADTKYDESLIEFTQSADLIYHEATFLKDEIENAANKFHATTEQAANIALKSGAKKLIIGHFSGKYHDLSPFEEEARAIFKNTELAIEGRIFDV